MQQQDTDWKSDRNEEYQMKDLAWKEGSSELNVETTIKSEAIENIPLETFCSN